MRIGNGGIISQLTQNVIKRLGRNIAWRHAILFVLGRGKAIRESGIECQKSTRQTLKGEVLAPEGELRKHPII
jgi:hypothetical protein